MLSADGDKPVGKSGKRNRKAEQQGGKAGQRSRKSVQQQSPGPDQSHDVREQISAQVASSDSPSADTTHAESAPTDSVAPAETVEVSVQTIANAYGDYTRKSLEQTKCFFEELAGARSLGKAVEVQTDFVRQACETLVADAHKIRELQRDLARQNLERFEGLVTRMTKPR